MSTPKGSRKFDVVVWGCTGFTGKLICEYLAQQSKAGGRAQNVKWALAGRNRHKMQDLKESLLQIEPSLSKTVAILVAEKNTAEDLEAVSSATRVVIAAVGPYALHGTPMVQACLKTGTHYCDLTGEAQWHRYVIDTFHDEATKKGVLIVPSTGFDAVPSDIGAFVVASEIRKRFGEPCSSVKAYFSGVAGASGGTLASVFNIFSMPSKVLLELQEPFYLNPTETRQIRNSRVSPVERDQLLPAYDSDVQSWTNKWIMAAYNTRIVRRSVALFEELPSDNPVYAKDFKYNEYMLASNIITAIAVTVGLFLFGIMVILSPTRWLIKKFLPEPGQGPSAARRKTHWFRYTFKGYTADKKNSVTAEIRGADPGYDDTAKMISETALCMLQDSEEILRQRKGRGGVLTPATCCGLRLTERINAAEVSVQIK